MLIALRLFFGRRWGIILGNVFAVISQARVAISNGQGFMDEETVLTAAGPPLLRRVLLEEIVPPYSCL